MFLDVSRALQIACGGGHAHCMLGSRSLSSKLENERSTRENAGKVWKRWIEGCCVRVWLGLMPVMARVVWRPALV